jgi:hypothetical protein
VPEVHVHRAPNAAMQPIAEGAADAIYRSDTKYEESRRVPFVVLQDRLRRALHQPETLVIVAGYSFNDAHLNELLFDGAARRERSEFIVFCYSAIPEVLAKRGRSVGQIGASGRSNTMMPPWCTAAETLP